MSWTKTDLANKQYVELEGGGFARADQIGKLVTGKPKHQPVELESELHAAILSHCKFHGWPVVHSRLDVPQTAEIGTPDFVIAMPGPRTVWVEAKARQEKPTPKQLAWLASLRRVGHAAHVVRSMEEFLEVVK